MYRDARMLIKKGVMTRLITKQRLHREFAKFLEVYILFNLH